MDDILVASGAQIYDALVEGAKRKYNRSTDDFLVYEKILSDTYEYMLDDNQNKSECEKIRKRTKNNWKNANFPITFLMFHKHRAMQPCETHARICLLGTSARILDIPLEYYELFEKQSRKFA